MSRVINPDGAGKERNHLCKLVVLASHELNNQNGLNETTRDLTAFIMLLLTRISETVEISVAAWEKRGYWVKADRFRMEWAWASKYAGELMETALKEDWNGVTSVIREITRRLDKVTLPKKNKFDRPWSGACLKLKQR